ncbi:MAG: PD40 domain-containing protein [Acidobacteria bacterium]|nr:PD40 domain-containing protein [Acidobacteriota bacterium]
MTSRILLATIALSLAAGAQTKLLRFPDLHGNDVVFTYAGDLWKASAAGGLASRLTAHPGLEIFAKFSPDGKWIAFTGQYDGDEQVYVIPSMGGVPKQLTYYPARGPLPPRWGWDNIVMGWTPDGKGVVFRSLRDHFSVGDGRLYVVAPEGGLPKALPMPYSGAGDLSPDGTRIVYSPLARDFRTWKRYQGGWAQDLYVFDLKTHQLEPVSHSPRTERDPMWIGSRICFSSDRTGTMNLYEFDPETKRTRALTDYKDWDVRWASKANDGRIVFELNGELHVIDVKPGSRPRRIAIQVPNDGVASRPAPKNVGHQVASIALSPKGERALLEARGDVFTVPIESGPVRNLTKSSGAHDKAPAWSPDGSKIVFLSDRSGEEELYLINQDGSGQAEQLTRDGKAMRYQPQWSPDGKKIAFSDKDGKLYVLTLADKSVKEVADEPRDQLLDYEWAPDSAHLAFSMTGSNENNAIYIWSEKENRLQRVTDELFESRQPAWDPEGNYLYFISERDYAPLISNNEWNYATSRNRGIFALALRKDARHPFPPKSDEVTPETKAEEKKADEKKAEFRIDFDGIETRVARAPLPAHNYHGLAAIKGHLLYVRGGNFFYGRDPDVQPELVIYSLGDRKETVLAENATSVALSPSGNKVLVRQGQGPAQTLNLYDATPRGRDTRKTLSTANLVVDRVPSQEWNQIFNEVWRRFRDFFYVRNMHGYDWEGLRRQYQPQLEYAGHRADLNYVIGEMISELNVSHAYIDGGDFEVPPRPQVALPGCRFELDEASGRYRIAKIFRGQNEESVYRAPLTEIGVDARVGDYVLEIEGEELATPANPYRLLRGKANQPVRLLLNDKPVKEGAREAVFNPVPNESNLIYLEMVESNRRKVGLMTNGRVGYLHIPNMGAEGIREFIKWYYGQIRKEGLIIDVRGNGGGNVSPMLIERLRRVLLGTRFSRTNDYPTTYPQQTFQGHMVCLLSETSASDGDIFPHMFRQAGLGPLIGKRSWGGVVGITNRGTLVDGGVVNVPEFGTNAPDGSWVIEGEGVRPDIVVENDPKSLIEGRDPQLERGVEEVMRRIQQNPKKLPQRPPDPVRTK